jgi:DNA-binding Lrp family transcriptional regulator
MLNSIDDLQVLQALQIDGRASFSLIGKVLGVSDQTIARRYGRLREAGRLRVRGLVEPSKTGVTQWIIRLRCTPSATEKIADALASRTDTAWISLTAGGTEIVCVVREVGDVNHPAPLLERLPLGRSILTIEAHCVLHEFFGGRESLINKNGPLSKKQMAALRYTRPETPADVRPLSPGDGPLLRALEIDGRTTITSLATTTGWSQSSVRRRIAELVDAHILYFDVDFDQTLLNVQMRAVMWLKVPTHRLADLGAALAEHAEVGYVAATTGATNLYAAISCHSSWALYSYLTEKVARLSDIDQIETVPVTRSVKAAAR